MRRILPAMLFTICITAPVFAQNPLNQRMEPGGHIYSEFSGSSHHLPVDCRLTAEAIAIWARNMTPTQAALAEAGRRGYVAVKDSGFNLCSQGMSAAILGYQKPGVPNSAVTILVTTQVNPENGEPSTTVTGGMLIADFDTHTLVVADDIGALAQTDGAFIVDPVTNRILRDVPTPSGRRAMDADSPVENQPTTDSMQKPSTDGFGGPWDAIPRFQHAREGFKKFARCLHRNANICLMADMLMNSARYTSPAGLISAIGSCVAIASVSCFYFGQ